MMNIFFPAASAQPGQVWQRTQRCRWLHLYALLLGSLLLTTQLSQAQTPGWVRSMGGSGIDQGTSIAIDASGNVYITGHFQNTVDFDPGTGTANLTSAGGDDIFLSKFNASGNHVWTKQMGGDGGDRGFSVTVDASGNIYLTGYFQNTADFDPGSSTANLTAVGGVDIFVSKLNASGDYVWARQMGGTGDEQGNAIAVDGDGNVYTTGHFQNTVDFNPGAGTTNLTGGGIDVFVSKLNASGDYVWAKQMGTTDTDQSNAIAVDGAGNVYTTGIFRGTVDFDPSAETANLTATGVDIFVSKLNTSGGYVWAKRMGGTDIDQGFGITVDGDRNVYTTGSFRGTADFDPGTATVSLTAAGSNSDIFVSKLNSSGDYVWAKRMGGTAADLGYSIMLDGTGNVYTTGSFRGTADFDPGIGTASLTPAGNDDIFVSKLDASGDYVWAKRMGGTSLDQGRGIAVNSTSVYATGYFAGTADFDPDAATLNLTAEINDIFVIKLGASDGSLCGGGVSVSITAMPSLTIASGGSATLTASGADSYTWSNGSTQNPLIVSNVTSATAFSVTGLTGACSATASAAVSVTAAQPATPITLQVSASAPVVCPGSSANLLVTASGGTGLYSYTWVAPPGATISGSANTSALLASVTTPGGNTFTVTVADGSGALVSSPVIVQVSDLPTPTLTAADVCSATTVLSLTGTDDAFSLQWYQGSTLISSQSATYPGSGQIIGGGNGSGNALNQLPSPRFVTTDAQGNVYVSNGKRVSRFGPGSTSATNGVVVTGDNGDGNAPNQLKNPGGVIIDAGGNLIVADILNNRIQKFPPGSTQATDGITIAGGNGYGSALNQFKAPVGIRLDQAGYLYVSEEFGNRVIKFPPNSTSATAGTIVAGGNGEGDALNQFYQPLGLWVTPAGDVYVSDRFNSRVLKFPAGSTQSTNGIIVAGGNGNDYEDALNQIDPSDVYVDEAGNIYVADLGSPRVMRFPAGSSQSTNGIVIAGGNGYGSGLNQLNDFLCLTVDAEGILYVADGGNNRLMKYVPTVPTSYTTSSVGAYSVKATNALGCSVSSNTVTIGNTPMVSIAPSSQTVTSGGSVTLTASGASSYTWSTGQSGSAITVSNVTSVTTLSVTGLTGACSATASASVSVTAPTPFAINPTVGTLGPNTCLVSTTLLVSGNRFTVTGPGNYAVNRSFRTTLTNFSLIVNSMTRPGTYTVTAYNALGQTTLSYYEVDGTACQSPILQARIRPDERTARKASTGLSLTMVPSSLTYGTGQVVTVRVTGGQSGTAYSVDLYDSPSYTTNLSNFLSYSTSQGTGNTVQWGANAVEEFYVIFQPGSAGIDRILEVSDPTFTDFRDSSPFAIQDCTPVSVSITATPSLTVLGGSSVTLTASGADSFTWSNGVQSTSVVLTNLSSSTALSVTGVTGVCSSTARAAMVVIPCNLTAVITPNPGLTICTNAGGVLTATGAGDGGRYVWSTNATTAAITVNSSGPYSVTAINSVGCSSTAIVTVTALNPAPLAQPVLSASSSAVCEGGSVSVTATVTGSVDTYQWYKDGLSLGSAQSSSVLTLNGVSSAQAGSYVLVIGSSGCGSATSTAFTLTVNPLPVVTITFPPSAVVNPAGPVVTVPVGQGLSYQVFGGGSNGRYERKIVLDRINGFEIRTTMENRDGIFPIDKAGPYTITVTDSNGCSRTVTGEIRGQ